MQDDQKKEKEKCTKFNINNELLQSIFTFYHV